MESSGGDGMRTGEGGDGTTMLASKTACYLQRAEWKIRGNVGCRG